MRVTDAVKCWIGGGLLIGTIVGLLVLMIAVDPYADEKARWDRPYDVHVYLDCVRAYNPRGFWATDEAHAQCVSVAQDDYAARMSE